MNGLKSKKVNSIYKCIFYKIEAGKDVRHTIRAILADNTLGFTLHYTN